MIIFKGREDVILGTNGEDAIVAALRLYANTGRNAELVAQCVHLLKYLGKEK
jgi:hypothetical protein